MTFRIGVAAMIVFAKLFNGLAEETNSPAVVEDLFAAPLPVNTSGSPKLLPALDVQSYRVEGLTTLPPAEFGVLSNYTGKVDLSRVQEGMEKLQSLYRESGFTNVTVTLPEQTSSNGVVEVKIVETDAEMEHNLAGEITNLFLAPESRKSLLDVRGYQIEGNTVMPVEQFNFLTNYIGRLDFARLREGLGKLQLRYREFGFATVNVTLPQQRLTNGIVRVKVVEGRLSDIIVEGNRYYSTDNVRRALPSLTTNILLNSKWFQPELDRANASQDRQIYPVISPGLEPGTSDLTLKVKDQLPLHEHVEINDKSTPDTPLLRVDTAVQYANLWQREQQIGFDYNFSPQEFKPAGDFSGFYDQPMVASYSGYYRIPLAFDQGLREDYDNLPVNFGYDEVTHKFNLPPATGNPDVVIYASRSTSDTPVNSGPLTTIFTNTLANISSQSQQRTVTANNNLGTKLTIPLREFLGVKSSLLLGIDYKSYQAQTYSTNLTYFDLYALDSFGNPVLVTNETIRLPANNSQSLYYLPLSAGWAAVRPDKWGAFSFNYNQSVFLSSLSSARSGFQSVAGSPSAGGNYTTIIAGLVRQENLPGDWSAVLNANGQWASEPLISNEQMALGGTGGVRGYQEGENYGDTGWRALFDLRAPPINVGYFPTQSGDVPADLRCSWFMDVGQTFLIDRPAPADTSITQWGTGLGFFLTAGSHLSARLALAWALHDTPTTPTGSAQAYFSIGTQF
jgi:hemolysin activation/secretion protein